MTMTPLTTPIIDILGLTAGVPLGTDFYPAVDTTDMTQSPQGTTKKYSLGALFNFILNGIGLTTTVNAIAASTGNYFSTYNNGSSGVNAFLTDNTETFLPFEIDGIPGVVGDVYLIKNQLAQYENGLYVLVQNGDNVSVPWILMRTFSFNSTANIINGAVVFVVSGVTQVDTAWQLSFIPPLIVGTTNLVFTQTTYFPLVVPLPISVANGGTGDTSFIPDSLIAGGATSTSPLQSVGTGAAGQILISAGPGLLPIWGAESGSGTVNPGTINDLAYYAASGNAVSPLASADNGVLVTGATGIPSISSTLPAGLIIPGYQGTISFSAVGIAPNTAGASITGGVITLEPASATLPGLVSSTTQTFAGAKTFQLGITANGGAINLGTDSGNDTIDIGTGSGGSRIINIGTAAATETINIGNNSGATEISMLVGSAGWIVDGQGASSFTIGLSITTGNTTIGGNSQSGTITLGESNSANIVNIANGTGPTTTNIAANSLGGSVNIASGATTATVNIGGSAETGTITIGSSTGTNVVSIAVGIGLGTVNIGTGGGSAKTINIGNASSTNTVVLGSLFGTSTTTINAGSGGVVFAGLTASAALYLNASKVLTSVALTNGQLLMGSTGAVPVANTITAGSGVTVINGAGTITISATGSGGTVTSISAGTGITLTPNPIVGTGSVALTLPVAVTSGGTGLLTTTINQLLYSSAANTIAGLATVNSAVLATSSTGVPTWEGPLTNGQIIIGSTGANPIAATITQGAGITVTNAPGSITIASTITGTVTSISAGTGITLSPSPITTTGSVSLTVPVVVANGGTGDTTFTPYAVITAGTTGAGAFQNVVGVGLSGQVLTSQGASLLPIWANATGTGTVNSGTINDLAYYASSTNAVSPLATANSGVLVTSGTGVPSISSTLPAFITSSITFSPTTGGIVGTTTNDNAAAGKVGEIISSVILSGSAIAIAHNATAPLTSLSVTAGDWDIWGNVNYPTVGTSCSYVYAAVTTSAITNPDSSTVGIIGTTTASIAAGISVQAPMLRFSFASTTTVYILGTLINTSGSGTMCGAIFARRIR